MRCLEKDADDAPADAPRSSCACSTTVTSGSATRRDARDPARRARHARQALPFVRGGVRRRRDRREGGDRRHRTARLGVPGRARRHGARTAGDPLHRRTCTARRGGRSRRADLRAGARTGTMATIAIKASPHVTWRRTGGWRGGARRLRSRRRRLHAAARAGHRARGASLLARGSVANREPLLITDFKTQGADTNLGSVVTEAVRADMGQSSTINLVSPVRVAAALQRMQRPSTMRVDLALAREIAAREGIKAIIDGEITPLGAGYVVAARLVSADSGLELTSSRTVVKTPADLIDGINKVSKQLRGKIGESLRSVQSSPALAQVTTAASASGSRRADGFVAGSGDEAKADGRVTRPRPTPVRPARCGPWCPGQRPAGAARRRCPSVPACAGIGRATRRS